MGVALGGGGRGVSRIWTNGGVENLLIGSAGYGVSLGIRPGQVGVNTASPTANLDINGTARVRALQHAHAEPRTVMVDSSGTLSASPIRTITLPASSFRADVSSTETVVNFDWITVSGTGFARLFAPVVLPSGARIESISAVAYDNLATVDLEFDLIEDPLAEGLPLQTIASWETSGAATSRQQLNAAGLPATVDTSDNQYYIRAEPRTDFGTGGWGSAADLRIYAVSIDYRI
jgi:hypothetical protein